MLGHKVIVFIFST